jgi:hypothetical protein
VLYSAEVDSVQQRRTSFPCLESKSDSMVVTLTFRPYTDLATCFMLYKLILAKTDLIFLLKTINTVLLITKEGMVWKLSTQRQTINLIIYSDGKFGEKRLIEGTKRRWKDNIIHF